MHVRLSAPQGLSGTNVLSRPKLLTGRSYALNRSRRAQPSQCFLAGLKQGFFQLFQGTSSSMTSSTTLRSSASSGASTEDLTSDLKSDVDSTTATAAATSTTDAPSEATNQVPDADIPEEKKSDEYSTTMQRKMGGTLTYRHELGIDYNRVIDDLIVGSCLQTAADVDRLAEEEGVTTVFSLQEDCDMEYFNLDINPIQERCRERGDIRHVRFPVRDFDPQDLRRKLPKAIATLAKAHNPEEGTIYIHCTAGMGRAPGTALAYMYWLRGLSLEESWERLRAVRACNPKLEAIRGATADILMGLEPVEAMLALKKHGNAKTVQVAGLDVGWNTKLDLEWDAKTARYILRRTMQPGRYQYKFVLDDHWTYSVDHPTMDDGGNINNWLEVSSQDMDVEMLAKQTRLLQPGGSLTEEERKELAVLLSPWRQHPPADGPRFNFDD